MFNVTGETCLTWLILCLCFSFCFCWLCFAVCTCTWLWLSVRYIFLEKKPTLLSTTKPIKEKIQQQQARNAQLKNYSDTLDVVALEDPFRLQVEALYRSICHTEAWQISKNIILIFCSFSILEPLFCEFRFSAPLTPVQSEVVNDWNRSPTLSHPILILLYDSKTTSSDRLAVWSFPLSAVGKVQPQSQPSVKDKLGRKLSTPPAISLFKWNTLRTDHQASRW